MQAEAQFHSFDHDDSRGSHSAGRRAGDTPSDSAILHAAVETATESATRSLVLAISGGRDSMALLYAMAQWARPHIAAVATYDHATGGAATEASALVAAEARRLGLTVVRERAFSSLPRNELAWRKARWDFLNRVARAYDAQVVTAHTRDDQLETVVMRELRGTGARGLAALAAPSDVLRPWLPVTRGEVASWVRENRIPYVEDPSNQDRRYLRVRVRHDLLPAFERAHPGFAEEMLAVAERAAAWRREVDALLLASGAVTVHTKPRSIQVLASFFDGLEDDARAVYLQALFGMAGVALDTAGTRTLVRFSRNRRRGSQVQLAGGATALLTRGDSGADVLELRPRYRTPRMGTWSGAASRIPVRIGGWRFVRGFTPDTPDEWDVALPVDAEVTIRSWRAGDKLQIDEKSAQRRVARYFAEAGVPAPDRKEWPVVLVDKAIVWVPGVCRSPATPLRPGRSEQIWYRCERDHG